MGNQYFRMKFVLAIAAFAVATQAIKLESKADPLPGVNFVNSLDSEQPWGNFKTTTGKHSAASNALRLKRNAAVKAYFAAKVVAGKAAATLTEAQKKNDENLKRVGLARSAYDKMKAADTKPGKLESKPRKPEIKLRRKPKTLSK